MNQEDAEREVWRREQAPDWAMTIEAIRMLESKYAGRLPVAVLGDDGKETMVSMGARMKALHTLAMAETGGRWQDSPYTYQAWRRLHHPTMGDEERKARERIQSERFYGMAAQNLRIVGLGERLIDLMPDVQDSRAVVMARRWLREGKRWALILGGKGGSGKSVALGAALYGHCRELVRTEGGVDELMWRTSKGRYVLAADLFGGPAFGPEAEARFGRFSGVELLCLDDLGLEQLSEVSKQMLFRLLDARYRNKLRTLIATNLSWPELVQRYGSRLERRLNPSLDDGAGFLALDKPFAASDVPGAA